MNADQLAQLVGGAGAGLLSYVAFRLRPWIRMQVRLSLAIYKLLRRREAAIETSNQGSPDGTPNRPRTVTPSPDELELAAQRLLDSLDK